MRRGGGRGGARELDAGGDEADVSTGAHGGGGSEAAAPEVWIRVVDQRVG